jgi:hypothetical protein
MWNLASFCLETLLVQCKMMVCARHGIGLEIVLDTLDGTTKVTRLRWKLILVLLDIMLILTQNRCTGCVKCTIDS